MDAENIQKLKLLSCDILKDRLKDTQLRLKPIAEELSKAREAYHTISLAFDAVLAEKPILESLIIEKEGKITKTKSPREKKPRLINGKSPEEIRSEYEAIQQLLAKISKQKGR